MAADSTPLTSPRISTKEILEFLKKLISEQAGISVSKISVTDNMSTYGIASIGVVKATQRLSDFFGVPVAAIDVFSASCIQELANFSENLLLKSQPHHMNNPSYAPEDETESTEFVVDVSKSHQWSIYALQPLALVFISILLVSPAYLSITTFQSLIASVDKSAYGIPWSNYLVSLALAPLSWILCVA